MARYVVGIDLGTSHTVAAWAPVNGGTPALLPIAQRVRATEQQARTLLPSAAYIGASGEFPAQDELDETDGWVLGEVARQRGTEVPGRLIASAKSWLCHRRVDRQAAILPWGAPDETPKLSPVSVSARLLGRIKRAWQKQHPNVPLEEQEVVVTVPASFDETARELTLEAARIAGLEVRLLEEPQAALFASMARAALDNLMHEPAGAVLVIDVGGGTTDLSLFQLVDGRISRVAVGPHLLLGGDNMDLALARLLEKELTPEGERTDAPTFATLTAAARSAKERLLGTDPKPSVRIGIAGRGSQLLGSARSVELTRETAIATVLEGFFPATELTQRAASRAGLVALGLPYERDVAITRHVATFLRRHLPENLGLAGLLLNGGVFHAPLIRERIRSVVSELAGHNVPELASEDPDLAVALGAVRFGLSLHGIGRRIEAGAKRSYWIAVAGAERDAQAVCVLPKGTPAETTVSSSERRYRLRTGELVRFELWSNDDQPVPPVGTMVATSEGLFREATLSTKIADKTAELQVFLEAELSSVGSLTVSCVEADPLHNEARRFRLAFQLDGADTTLDAAAPIRRQATSQITEAEQLISCVFGKGTSSTERQAKDLSRGLEKLLGSRQGWSADTSRALADRLLSHEKGRRRSVDHERVFFQLTGYCMRPGFGAPGDAERAKRLAALFSEKPLGAKDARSVQQFLIALRRVAAGFSEAQQTNLRDQFDGFVAPREENLKRPKWIAADMAEPELLDLLSQLERVKKERRAELGSWILERTWTRRDPRLWAALGRVGARAPLFASVHQVVSPSQVEKWLDQLLRDKWSDLPTAANAASEMARLTDDRTRDVSLEMQKRVLERLRREQAAPELIAPLEQALPLHMSEKAAFLGEALPSGLTLIDSEGGAC